MQALALFEYLALHARVDAETMQSLLSQQEVVVQRAFVERDTEQLRHFLNHGASLADKTTVFTGGV